MKNESGNIMTQSVSLNDFAVWCILDSRVTSYELLLLLMPGTVSHAVYTGN